MTDFAAELEKELQHRRPDVPTPQAAFQLAHKRLAVVYQRQSSHEQRRRNIWSQHAQDGLAEAAADDGYPDELIIVEKRDLGITGRKTERGRPGFARLISLVEEGKVESIWVIACDRLYRDMEYENADRMANSFRKHGIVICTPYRRYNLRLDEDYDEFHDEMAKAVRENRRRTIRLTTARRSKAAAGFWPGTPVPAGFQVVKQKDCTESSYDIVARYEPHAEIVPSIFRMYIDKRGSKLLAAQTLYNEGLTFPFFPKELAYMESRSSLRRTPKTEFGYIITPELVESIVTNPIYIGWWTYAGLINKKHHPPLVGDDIFWTAYRLARSSKPRGKATRFEPLAFNGLAWCVNHDEPRMITSLNAEGRYVCDYHYKIGVAGKCLSIARSQLEEPLLSVILWQLDLNHYAGRVLDELQKQQRLEQFHQIKRQGEREALRRKIKNLEAGLDDADTKAKRELIWQRIAKHEARLTELDNVAISEFKILDSDIDRVRAFLGNIGVNWQNIGRGLQNRLLRLILNAIYLRHDRRTIHATIQWKTGYEQKVVIQRPILGYCDDTKWGEEEEALLKMLWPSSSKKCVISAFPGRTWESLSCKARKLRLRRIHMLGDKTERTSRSRKPLWEVISEDVILNQEECLQMSLGRCR